MINLYGHETGFARTIKATTELIEICPDKDIRNIEVLTAGGNITVQYMPQILAILQNGFERKCEYEALKFGKTYEPYLMTAEDFEYLDEDTYQECITLAFRRFRDQSKTTVSVKEKPGKKTEEANQ